jgi:hypothetical protein
VSTEISNPASIQIPITKSPSSTVNRKTITRQEYSDHMSLTSAQLETVALMLQVLEKANGGDIPSE